MVPGSLRILLVDDHPDAARAFTMMLDRRGYAVTAVASVEGAKAALGSADFDLLLCDYSLDDGTAIDLITWLEKSGSRLRSICVTGHGAEIAKQCRLAGFEAVLTKPVKPEVLEAAIASLAIRTRSDVG